MLETAFYQQYQVIQADSFRCQPLLPPEDECPVYISDHAGADIHTGKLECRCSVFAAARQGYKYMVFQQYLRVRNYRRWEKRMGMTAAAYDPEDAQPDFITRTKDITEVGSMSFKASGMTTTGTGQLMYLEL